MLQAMPDAMGAKRSASQDRPAPTTRVVKCPQCGKEVPWAPESRYRPFCSQRCKMIDLGTWASEGYRVPVVEKEDDDSSSDGGNRLVD
jgi:uncharacterized protein